MRHTNDTQERVGGDEESEGHPSVLGEKEDEKEEREKTTREIHGF